MAHDFVVLEAISLGTQPQQVPSKPISEAFGERCSSLRRVPWKKPVSASLPSLGNATAILEKRHHYDDILNLAKRNHNHKSTTLPKAAHVESLSETNNSDFAALTKQGDQPRANMCTFKIPKRKNDTTEEVKKAENTHSQNDKSKRLDAKGTEDNPLDSMRKTRPPPAIRTDMTQKQHVPGFRHPQRRRPQITDFSTEKAKIGGNTAPIPAVNQDLSLDPRRHRLVDTASSTLTHAVPIASVVEKEQKPSYAKMHREHTNDANSDTGTVTTVLPEFQKTSVTGSTIPIPAWRRLLVNHSPVSMNDHNVVDMDIDSESTTQKCGVEAERHGSRNQEPNSNVYKPEFLETSTPSFPVVSSQDVTLLLSTCDGPTAKVISETCPMTATANDIKSALNGSNACFMPNAQETAPALNSVISSCHTNPENVYHAYGNSVSPVVSSTPPFPASIQEAFPNGSAPTAAQAGGIVCSQKRLVLPPLPPPPRVDMDFLHRTSPDMLSTEGQIKWLEQAIARVTYFSELYNYRDRVRKTYLQKFV